MGTVHTVGFGDLVRRYRVKANLTQEELAERAGLSARAISDIERGAKHTPRRDTVELLAEALELTAEEHTAFQAAARRVGAAPAAAARGTGPLDRYGSALPALVGRTRESAALDRHLAGEGPPVLLLAGEPGIGKTRLLHEAGHRASAAGWTVVWGSCSRRGGQEPFAPLVDALQSHIQLQSPAQLRALLQRCAWLVRLLPELVESADVPVTALASLALPPEQERRLMFGAVGRFLANAAGPAGTLLILDDLHWAGPDALDLLSMLVRIPPDKPLRVIGSYRDVDVRLQDPLAIFLVDLVRDGLAAQLRLGPLSREEAGALLQSLLVAIERPEAAVSAPPEQVLQRAEGVPFFLVSIAQGLDTGALEGGAPGGIPWTLAQSVRQRVAALPKTAQDVLGAVAVAGAQATHRVVLDLARQSGWDEPAVLTALDVACRAGLLAEVGDDSYQFAHDLIRGVVHDDLGAARRAALHRRVAEVLEREPRAWPAEVLAYHYDRGGEVEQSLTYLEAAGDRALSVHANAAAAGFYKDLVGRLDALGRSLECARAREKLGATLRIVGRYDPALEALERAAETYRAAGDPQQLGRAMAQVGRVHARRGTPQEGIQRLLPLVKTLEDAQATRGLAAVQVALGELYYAGGRPHEQLAAATRGAELAQGLSDDALLAGAEHWRSIALLALGRMDEALPALKDVLPLAEASGDLSSYSHSLNHVALAYIQRGEFGESQSYIERALAAAHKRGDPAQIAFMTYNRGLIAYFKGEWAQARQDYEHAADAMRQIGIAWSSVYPLLGLGQLALVQGQWHDAAGALQEATAMAERSGDLQALRFAYLPQAEHDLLEGQPEHARTRLDRLLDRSRIGWDEGVADLLAMLAWTYLEMGDDTQAETLVTLSITRALAEQNRLALVDALRVQAIWALRQERPLQAAHALDEALALARAMPYPYGAARVLYTRGLALATQDPAAARTQLDATLDLLHGLGERLYAQHVEAALAPLTPSTDRP